MTITWGDPIPHDGSPDCPADARGVLCMVKGPEWEPWRTVDAHADHTDHVYWPNVTAYRIPVTAPDAVLADLVVALSLAANRLHRCSIDYGTGTREFIEVGEWANEARAALTAYKEQQK